MPKVLLVDDEALVRLTVAEVLEDSGFEVVEAESAPEAAEILMSRNDVDAVLTDIRMPGAFDGMELARRVSESWPRVKVLVMSGWSTSDPSTLPQSARFLRKPFESQVLTRELAGLLSGR